MTCLKEFQDGLTCKAIKRGGGLWKPQIALKRGLSRAFYGWGVPLNRFWRTAVGRVPQNLVCTINQLNAGIRTFVQIAKILASLRFRLPSRYLVVTTLEVDTFKIMLLLSFLSCFNWSWTSHIEIIIPQFTFSENIKKVHLYNFL